MPKWIESTLMPGYGKFVEDDLISDNPQVQLWQATFDNLRIEMLDHNIIRKYFPELYELVRTRKLTITRKQ